MSTTLIRTAQRLWDGMPMEKLLADNFQRNPGVKLAITTVEIEQLGLRGSVAGGWRKCCR